MPFHFFIFYLGFNFSFYSYSIFLSHLFTQDQSHSLSTGPFFLNISVVSLLHIFLSLQQAGGEETEVSVCLLSA
uniref:Uncharacterized protein n=1 Tax=Salix viminalis TaxID=40686 RepID=A0A6N2LEU9_SALVM